MAKSPTNPALLKYRTQVKKFTSEDNHSTNTKFISTSTELNHVVTMIILTICRKCTIGIKLQKRLFIYFCLIVFGGILCDFAPILVKAFMPFKTTKDSILNQWFVKIGWFWTLILVGPFTHFTSKIIGLTPEEDEIYYLKESEIPPSVTKVIIKQNQKLPFIKKLIQEFWKKHVLRLILNTFIFFSSIFIFQWLEEFTSSCSVPSIKAKDSCLKFNYRWTSFDISGHTFLLLFSNLIVLEECNLMKGWEPFGEYLSIRQQEYQRAFKIGNPQYLMFKKYKVYIRCLFVFLTFLSFLWDFMLIQTVLFYHTMIQKFVAFVWATLLWFFTYRILYKHFNLIHMINTKYH